MNCVDVPNRSAEEIRTKLSRENDMYLMTQRVAAPHYFVSSRNQVISSPAIDFQVGTCHLRNLVAMLAALRFSSVPFNGRIPRYLYIEGRQVEVSQGIKKWYSIQLAAEEPFLCGMDLLC
jgi:hypothetical protein